jgi:hypothetical protein
MTDHQYRVIEVLGPQFNLVLLDRLRRFGQVFE